MKSALDQMREIAAQQASAEVPKGADIAKRCPNLWELLTRTSFKGGRPRKPMTVILSWEAGKFSVFMRCDSEGLQRSQEVSSLEELWEALESKISGPEPGWKETKEARRRREAPPKPEK